MDRKSLTGLLIALLLSFGCGPSNDPTSIEGGLNLFSSALLAHDSTSLLARCSGKTHSLIKTLHTELREQSKHISQDYPVEHRAAALGAYPVGILEAESEVALFKTLIEEPLSRLEPTEGLRYGMTMFGSPVVAGEQATALTQSGESVEFVMEEGEWKATVFENPLRQNLERIRINGRTMAGNLKILKEHAAQGKSAP